MIINTTGKEIPQFLSPCPNNCNKTGGCKACNPLLNRLLLSEYYKHTKPLKDDFSKLDDLDREVIFDKN